MEILQVDIGGKMAHFRKYYANNTAMSYSIPPRTTIVGMLAAILGKSKDSYYEAFSSKHIRIGVAVKSPLKKNFHRLNFLSLKKLGDIKKSFESDFRGMAGNPIQTPFEVVSGLDIRTDELSYRIFLSCFDTGKELFGELKDAILYRKQVFALTLGTANFSASVTQASLFGEEHIDEKIAEEDWIVFNSAVDSDKVSSIDFNKEEELNHIEEELLPADFKANYDRELIKMNRLLFSTSNLPLKVCYSGIFYQINKDAEVQTIQLID